MANENAPNGGTKAGEDGGADARRCRALNSLGTAAAPAVDNIETQHQNLADVPVPPEPPALEAAPTSSEVQRAQYQGKRKGNDEEKFTESEAEASALLSFISACNSFSVVSLFLVGAEGTRGHKTKPT